ncbi:hypothetical protein [Parabacteroides goldsteinii]|uniref:hypothetical protein n=1 Tax=Parabacteroides goldsteinii TaxID=328812 RepID=UPI0018974E1C|nr:hypothetical protein [Parabacteroides goldsteinii]
MEKKVIYSNQEEIDYQLSVYQRAAIDIQELVTHLKLKGIPLNDNVLQMLSCNPGTLKEMIKNQASEDAEKLSRLPSIQKMVTNSLSIEIYEIDKLEDTLCRILKRGQGLALKYFQLKDGEVSLSADLEQDLIEKYTIYLDTENKHKAYEMALEIIEKLELLDKLCQENADGIYAISPKIFMRTNGIIAIQGNTFEINPHAIKEIQ